MTRTALKMRVLPNYTKGEELFNMITHIVGGAFSIAALVLGVIASAQTGDAWKIGIQNPFDNRGKVVGVVEVSNKSVVTSGIYERFIEKDGVRYHHILNPKSGYPYETTIAGVSIVSDKSVDADALSTLVFTKGVEEGLTFVESIENVDAIFVTNDKKVYKTY